MLISFPVAGRLLFLPLAFFLFALPAAAATVSLPLQSSLVASAPTPDSTCKAEKQSHSASSTKPVSFTLANHSSVTLTLFWLNFNGARVKYFDLAPFTSAPQPTFVGHVWVVALPDGACVHFFTVTTPFTLTVGTDSPPSPSTTFPNARLQGIWSLQATVTNLTPADGVPASAMPSVGTSGVALVNIVPTCPAPAACSVNVLEASPGSASGTFTQGGLVAPGPGPFALLAPSGSLYTYSPSGFGSAPCTGLTTHYFSAGLVLSITAAAGNPPLATAITGSEHVLGASCVNNVTTAFFYTLTINQGTPLLASPAPLAPSPSASSFLPSLNSQSSQPPISSTLATPLQVFSSPLRTLLNLALAAAIVLFLTFPSQLFNHTLEENYAEIRRRSIRFLHLPASWESPPVSTLAPKNATAAPLFWLIVALGALLGSLLNPRFGFNLPTLFGLLATAFTILWGLLVSYTIARAFRSARHTPSSTYFKALPAGLLVAALCVLVSRLTDFTPGYLYGVVYSVAFLQKLPKQQDGQLTTLSSFASLLLALAAWLLWTPLHTLNVTGPLALLLLIATSVLASLFVGGLISNLLNLAPLRFLSGHKLFTWRRPVWALLFGFALFLVLQVLLFPAQGGHAGSTPLLTALILLGVFGLFSLCFWWYFASKKAKVERALAAKAKSAP